MNWVVGMNEEELVERTKHFSWYVSLHDSILNNIFDVSFLILHGIERFKLEYGTSDLHWGKTIRKYPQKR